MAKAKAKSNKSASKPRSTKKKQRGPQTHSAPRPASSTAAGSKGEASRESSPAQATASEETSAASAASGFACDVEFGASDPPMGTSNERAPAGRAVYRVHRRLADGFEGVPEMAYKPNPSFTSPAANDGDAQQPEAANAESPGWARVVRRELVGRLGPDPCDFHLRHFEVGPGGYSSFEQHRHIHAVIVESGTGEVRLESEWVSLSPGDVVYIGPNTPHQLRCPAEASEPFGFFCIVDAVRDRPVEIDDDAT